VAFETTYFSAASNSPSNTTMLFSSCAHAWTMMATSAGYLSSLVPDMSAHHHLDHHQPGAIALFQTKEHAFGIWNDYENNNNNNNTHPAEFTMIDQFWSDVVVVAATKDQSSGTHGAKSIDLISRSANGTTTASEYLHDDTARSCHCHCHEEQTASTTVQLAKRFDQAMASAADSWNKVSQQTERAATDFRDTVVNDYYPTMTAVSPGFMKKVYSFKGHVQQGYHRLLTTAIDTKTNTVVYMSDSLSVSTHTASDVLRSLLSPLLMQRSSPPPTTNITIDEGNSTKHTATISTHLIAMYDDNYNKHSAATMVDPCHLSKYDLGFPFGLLADGFFQSAYVPVCYPRSKDTCATFFAAPLQFLLDMISNDDCQAELDSWIPKQELDDAFRMYLHDELFSIVVQWWRNKIAATNKRIVSNVRVWIVSSGIQHAIEQAIATGMRAIEIGVEEGMTYFRSIWYQVLQVMIGVITTCCVIKWLVNAIQNHARRDRHQQCQGQVDGVSNKNDSLPNDDDSPDNSSSSLTSVHDNSIKEAVSTSDDGSGQQDESSSDRPPENVLVERKHAAVNRKGCGKPRKSLLGNIRNFVTRKRKVDEDEEVKPPFPAWSQFAVADTSRPYVEDYGNDDIGEGLGL
jgi:hypothetical protein